MTNQELEKYIELYGTDIYSFCRYITQNTAEAEDLYQDTWLTVVERLASIREEANVKSFCLSVAMKLWKNRKRKFAWRNRIAGTISYDAEDSLEYLEGGEASLEESICEMELSEYVRKEVDRLPENLKIVVILYYMEELSLAEIAKVLQIPQGTIKSRLFKARKILEEKLEDIQ